MVDWCDVGVVVMFIGFCCDEVGILLVLEFEYYLGMVEVELIWFVNEVVECWFLIGLILVYWYGKIVFGECIVFVVVVLFYWWVLFEVVDFFMDYLKICVFFWKKEYKVFGILVIWVEVIFVDDKDVVCWLRF